MPAAAPRTDGLRAGLIRLYARFSPRRRVQLLLVFFLMLVGAFAELVTLGGVYAGLAALQFHA